MLLLQRVNRNEEVNKNKGNIFLPITHNTVPTMSIRYFLIYLEDKNKYFYKLDINNHNQNLILF